MNVIQHYMVFIMFRYFFIISLKSQRILINKLLDEKFGVMLSRYTDVTRETKTGRLRKLFNTYQQFF